MDKKELNLFASLRGWVTATLIALTLLLSVAFMFAFDAFNYQPFAAGLTALEKQMRAERERRAVVAKSEGERQEKINVSEGIKQETINLSEAEKIRQINEAEGKAEEIKLVAQATADGIRMVAEAINNDGGQEAVSLRVAEQYVREFGKLAKENNTMILPAELANIGGAVAAITKTIATTK